MSIANELVGGRFVRQQYVFRDRVTADGSSGYPAEAGRYHLYVAWGCPWAHRTAIVRNLKGLDDAISLSAVDPTRGEGGWSFHERPDPVNGFEHLSQAYHATDPSYDMRCSVPVLWDRESLRIVSNNFEDITIMMETEFEALATSSDDLYPAALRDEIDEFSAAVYEDVNDGVYRCGFAQTQEAYEQAFDRLFARLDRLEERLTTQRYLVGGRLTEADVRLFPTLYRFDAVYHGLFRCNKRRLVDYPALWAYARDLYQRPAFRSTCHLEETKRGYWRGMQHLNPTRIVPKGPEIDWDAPHGREKL